MTIGLGSTERLSLRVSVATLSRVVFDHPDTGERMLALEHKAHSHSVGKPEDIFLQAQPFGGGAHLLNPAVWQERLGDFHFDSQRSRQERDFRIFIEPAKWPSLKEIVLEQARLPDSPLLDSDPRRELEEEFEDTISYTPRPDQYDVRRTGFVLEDEPVPTHSWRAPGRPTARLYCLDEVIIEDDNLAQRMLKASREQSPGALLQMARKRARAEGHGRANGMFLAPLAAVRSAYLSLDPAARDQPVAYGEARLSGNVVALLEGVESPKYQEVAN